MTNFINKIADTTTQLYTFTTSGLSQVLSNLQSGVTSPTGSGDQVNKIANVIISNGECPANSIEKAESLVSFVCNPISLDTKNALEATPNPNFTLGGDSDKKLNSALEAVKKVAKSVEETIVHTTDETLTTAYNWVDSMLPPVGISNDLYYVPRSGTQPFSSSDIPSFVVEDHQEGSSFYEALLKMVSDNKYGAIATGAVALIGSYYLGKQLFSKQAPVEQVVAKPVAEKQPIVTPEKKTAEEETTTNAVINQEQDSAESVSVPASIVEEVAEEVAAAPIQAPQVERPPVAPSKLAHEAILKTNKRFVETVLKQYETQYNALISISKNELDASKEQVVAEALRILEIKALTLLHLSKDIESNSELNKTFLRAQQLFGEKFIEEIVKESMKQEYKKNHHITDIN